MIDVAKILSTFPIFSSLAPRSLKALASIAHLQEFKRDEVIYNEEDPPDNLYVLISGRIKTYTRSSLAQGRVIEYLYKGTCFGIISLLTDEPHSVTVEAANDCLIVAIPKESFRQFLAKHPHLALAFSQILSRRVKKRADKDKSIFESRIISVYSRLKGIGKTTYSLMLARALAVESKKKIVVVEFRSLKKGFCLGISSKVLEIAGFNEGMLKSFIEKRWGFDFIAAYCDPGFPEASRNISFFLSHLAQDYNFIILDLPPVKDNAAALLLMQSDSIHCITKEPCRQKEVNSIKQTLISTYNIKADKISLILKTALSGKGICLGSKVDIFATLPLFKKKNALGVIEGYPDSQYARALKRVAREISSVRIGLALGSGAAFGAAHVGALKVFEENNIDIDIVSGSSMGSIIVGLWGLGKSWKEIRDLISKFKEFPVFSFLDVGCSGKAFLRGTNLRKLLKELFGDLTFHDLKRPVLIVAFDFKHRRAHVLSEGKFLLRRAILASCSMPGIFSPVKVKGDLLLDGGVLNPLPVDCLVERGVKKIISICVTPSKEEIRQVHSKMSGDKFNVFDFIFGSIEAMQEEIFQKALSLSDVVIHPKFGGIDWTNFKNIDHFIKQGEEETLRAIDRIKELAGT
jgi:NTE family protein